MSEQERERLAVLESQYASLLTRIDKNSQRLEEMNRSNIKTFVSVTVAIFTLVLGLGGLFVQPISVAQENLRTNMRQHEAMPWHREAGEMLSGLTSELKSIHRDLDKLTRITENSLRKSQNNSEFFPVPDAGMEIRERRIP